MRSPITDHRSTELTSAIEDGLELSHPAKHPNSLPLAWAFSTTTGGDSSRVVTFCTTFSRRGELLQKNIGIVLIVVYREGHPGHPGARVSCFDFRACDRSRSIREDRIECFTLPLFSLFILFARSENE
jgi:hypothetical protein